MKHIFLIALLFVFAGCAGTPEKKEPVNGDCKFMKRADRVPAFSDTQHRYIKCYDGDTQEWSEYSIRPIERSPAIIEKTKKSRERAPASWGE